MSRCCFQKEIGRVIERGGQHEGPEFTVFGFGAMGVRSVPDVAG